MSKDIERTSIMPQRSTDGVNMMNKCWWCVEEFKDADQVICEGSKLYHQHCLDERDRKDHLKPYEEKYPYLSQQHIENLLYEGQHCFETIDNNQWIVILDGDTSSEVHVNGFQSEVALKEFLKGYHKDGEHAGWDISAIYNNGQRYFYRPEIEIVLTPSKLS